MPRNQQQPSTKLSRSALQDWMRLSLAPRRVHKLLAKQPFAASIGAQVEAPLEALNSFWMQQLPMVDALLLQKTLDWLAADAQHFVVTRACNDFPPALAEIYDPPWLLYGSGHRQLLQSPMLAVVGSRRASAYGLQYTEQFSQALVAAGWGLCSGMAIGIDAAAHRAALSQGGATIAVLGTGADICYPPRQYRLFEQIQAQGLVLTEFFIGAGAKSDHFVRRNRIISGLSQGVLVMEATARSGSLVTARLALEQNRNLYAVPGPLGLNSYQGNHRLIQAGANLVTCAEDLLQDLPVLTDSKCNRSIQAQAEQDCARVEKPCLANAQMLANVGFETTSIDKLVASTRLPVATVMNQLISLELDGWVTAVPGGYVRVRRE